MAEAHSMAARGPADQGASAAESKPESARARGGRGSMAEVVGGVLIGSGMTRGRRIVESVHIAVLGVWAGALVLAGAAAAIVFPVMKSLDPKLPGFSKYDGPHWMLAGGQVGQRV